MLTSKQTQLRKSNPKTNRQNSSCTSRPQSAKSFRDVNTTKSYFCSSYSQHPQECLCKECTCGRHLCKFTSPSPTLSLSTTYKTHYPPRTPYKHNKAQKPFQMKAESPLLTFRSTYMDNFYESNPEELVRPKPQDMLACKGGPSMELTSYSQQFPGHRGKNQHVPVNPDLFRGGLPFNSNTSYSKEFTKGNGRSSEKAKPPDQFSMSGSWLGDSSYRNQYKNPATHTSPNKRARPNQLYDSKDKREDSNKNASSHFQTTYKNDFLKNASTVCPASRLVEHQDKGKFKQNSHFKGMDKSYISLAKFISTL